MRKIIPFIVFILLNVLFTSAQNIIDADTKMARQLVSDNSATIGIPVEILNSAIVSSTFEDPATHIRYVYLQQTYMDIAVHNQMQVFSFRNGKMLSNSGNFDPAIVKLVSTGSFMPSVSAESAVQSALSDRGMHPTQMAIALNRKDNGRFVEFSNMGVSQENITAKLN